MKKIFFILFFFTALSVFSQGRLTRAPIPALSTITGYGDSTSVRDFATNYTPSTTLAVMVIATVQTTVTALQTSTVNFLVGGNTIATVGQSEAAIAADNTYSVTFLVPPNTAYRMNNSGTGTEVLIRVSEMVIQ